MFFPVCTIIYFKVEHKDLQRKLKPTKFGSICNFHMMFAILATTKNHKNGKYYSRGQHRDLQPKPNPHHVWVTLKLSHDVDHFELLLKRMR